MNLRTAIPENLRVRLPVVKSHLYCAIGRAYVGRYDWWGSHVVNTRKANFKLDRLPEVKRMLKSNSVRSILLDDEGQLWMGISTYGFGIKDRKTGKFTHHDQMLDLIHIGGFLQ